jgi:outer membrane protein assembly factor BamB
VQKEGVCVMKKVICIVGVFVFLGMCQPANVSLGGNTNTDDTVPFIWGSLGGNFKRTGLSPLEGPTSGFLKRTFTTDAPVQTSVTIDAQGRIYVACMDGKLYCLNTDGSVDWVYDANSPLTTSPTITTEGILVGSKSGTLHVVDFSGTVQWTYQTPGPIYSCPAVQEDGFIIFGSNDGRVYALNSSGYLVWRRLLVSTGPIPPAIFASPAIADDGTIYIGTVRDPVLYALSPEDGSLRWECKFPGGTGVFASPVVGDDGIIYQTLVRDDRLYAVDPNDGSISWALVLADPNQDWYHPDCCAQIPDCRDEDGWSEPALGPDGTIYVSLDDAYLRAVNPNGTVKWGIRLGDVGNFTLAVDKNGHVYAACDSGHMYVIEPTGRVVAKLVIDHWLNYPVIGAEKTIILTDPTDRGLCTSECNHLLVIGAGILQ